MKQPAAFPVIFLTLLLSQPSAAPSQETRTVRGDNVAAWGSAVELVEEMRIGVLDGEPEYVFGWIVDMAMGPDGSIFIVEGQGTVVRKYSADGEYLHDIGREGGGPGEYKGAPEIEITPDGRLVMLDGGNRRVTFYDLDGNYLLDWPVPGNLLTTSELAVDVSGNLWLKTMTVDQERPEWDWPRSMVRISPAGEVLMTLSVPSEGRGAGSWVLASPEGYMWPFIEKVSSDLSPEGYLVTGSNHEYSFDLLHTGGTVLRVERDWEPVPLNKEERSEWEQWGHFFADQKRPGAPEVDTSIPKTKPAYRQLEVDEDGRVWVDRYVEAVHRDRPPREAGDERPLLTWFEPRTFDVYQPTGEFLGTVVLPPKTFVHCRRGMYLLGEQVGELEETYVARFRIEPSKSST
jgi:streptogramin lyase